MSFEFAKMSALEESNFALMPVLLDKYVFHLQIQNLNDYRPM